MGESNSCTGEHRFFVPEVIGVESEGKVFVPIVCTACGEFRTHEFSVGPKGSPIKVKSDNKT